MDMPRHVLLFILVASTAQAQDARYSRRPSDCRSSRVAGSTLPPPVLGAIVSEGYSASRTVSYSLPNATTTGGEIYVCTEYGRVEIEDSDDRAVRIQVRLDGYGEGAADPAAAARRVIDETSVRVYVAPHEGELVVHVWNDTLSFTSAAQPAFVSIRVQVPDRGAYRVVSEAFHGFAAIRRLTLGRSVMRGRVGDKFKGIPGYIGYTELDQVTVAGDVDIVSDGNQLSSPVVAKLRVASSASLTIRNGTDVTVSIQPHPRLGVRAVAASGAGTARVQVDGASARDTTISTFRTAFVVESPNFTSLERRLRVVATSSHGAVNLASMPAAPLHRP
jgi:hypothetical protein